MHMVKKKKQHPAPVRRRLLYDGLIAAGIAIVFFGGLWLMASSPSFMLFGRIVTHVETNEKVVALTFDDGPLPTHTEQTLATLQKLDVKATFFTIGVESKRHPDELKKIIAAGQEVGNHSYSHQVMALMPYDQVAREIESNDTLIRKAGYTGQIPFRVPYNIKYITLPYYLMRHDRPDISHDVSTNEGYGYTAKQIASGVVNKVKPGSIILLHPMYDHTATSRAAIPQIVNDLRAEGYRFVTVSQLLTYDER